MFELRNLAKSTQKEIIKRIISELKEALNKEYDFSKIDSLLVEFVRILNEPKSLEEDLERRKNTVKTKLNLENKEQVEKA